MRRLRRTRAELQGVEACRGVFPSPLWGGVRGGGRSCFSAIRPPSLTLPHKGGGNGEVRGLNSAHRTWRVGEIAREVLARNIAVVDRLDRAAIVFLNPAALAHPISAH